MNFVKFKVVWVRVLSVFRLSCVLFVSFLMCLGVIFTNGPNVRYLEYPHQCRQIFGLGESSVDLVVIGSSRSMRAMVADSLASIVFDRYGSPAKVVDLSRSYRDMGHMAVMLEDLLSRSQPGMLLVEYKETGEQWRHPNFYRTASFNQIFESFLSRPHVPLLGRLQESIRLILDRLRDRLTKKIEGKANRECVPVNKIEAKTSDKSKPWFVASELLSKQENKHHAEFSKKAYTTFDIESEEENRNNFYVKKVISMAEAKGVELYFYYIPPLYETSLSRDFISQFEAKFRTNLLQLSKESVQEINPKGYTDATHMGIDGSRVYMEFLAERLPWKQVQK